MAPASNGSASEISQQASKPMMVEDDLCLMRYHALPAELRMMILEALIPAVANIQLYERKYFPNVPRVAVAAENIIETVLALEHDLSLAVSLARKLKGELWRRKEALESEIQSMKKSACGCHMNALYKEEHRGVRLAFHRVEGALRWRRKQL